MSTVFELSLASRTETKVFHELYALAYYHGDERDSKYEDLEWAIEGYTVKDVIKTLEAEYPGKDVILCKDVALCLNGNYDCLPKGYIHTFLIRDPRRSITSFWKILKGLKLPPDMLPPTGGVKQLHDLHNYVTDTLNQESIIIDASDLADQP
ncbi:uncharacterized protein [Ptychodera flava]|uniref:uncharacterized protein n=1 Tax=Ptychodera flava TaxID=63121 RepID=UPI003969C041